MTTQTQEQEGTGNEEAHIEKAHALGIIDDTKKDELLGGSTDLLNGQIETAQEAGTQAEPAEIIQIGDKTFTSHKEAMSYAQEIERQRLSTDSYQQGMQDALSSAQTAQKGNLSVEVPKSETSEELLEKFYENPQKFLSDRDTKLTNQIRSEIENKQTQDNKAKELWTKFYKINPDLEPFREDCEVALERNWGILGKMQDADEAMKILAAKVRDRFRIISDSMKPKIDLPNTYGGVSVGGQGKVTIVTREEKPLDFISQIANMQDKKASV